MSRMARLALAAWVILIVGVSMRVAVAPVHSHTIVPIYLKASLCVQDRSCAYDAHPGMDVYRNPPGFAIAFVPFTFLHEKVAGILWRWIGIALVLLGLKHLSRDVLHLAASQLPWLYLLALPLSLSSFDNGQANLHIAGLLALATAAVARGSLNMTAVLLAVAVGIKVYPIAFVGLLVLVQWRLIPRVIVALAAVAAFPFLVLPWEYVIHEYTAFVQTTQVDDRTHTLLFRVPRDWTVITRTWLNWIPELDTVRNISLGVAIVMAAFVAITRAKPQVCFVLASIWMTLFGPATEAHTYTLLAPAMALAVVTYRGWARAMAIVAAGLLVSVIVRDAFPQGWRYAVLGPQPFGAFVLLVATVNDALKKSPTPVEASHENGNKHSVPTKTLWNRTRFTEWFHSPSN